jgi:hypothetical protein
MKQQQNKQARLESIRQSLRNGSASYGELHELQCMQDDIHPTDIELSEASGITEDEYRKRLELWELNNKQE